LQIQEGFTAIRYKGMLDCGVKIFREEGVRSLFHGISVAVLRQSIYGTLKFGSYYSIKNLIVTHYYNGESGQENMYINVTCAALAGAFSSALANPTDVLKVRMQAKGIQGNERLPLYKNFYSVYKTEGFRGLYRGVVPTRYLFILLYLNEV
jgi:solute carrier family 25 (mitochondrial carrier), member 14/30